MPKILAFESSCDETCAAVIGDGPTVLSDVVYSQASTHLRFGGVVPEIASREHLVQIGLMAQRALEQAHLHLQDLDAVAVTTGPGLIGSLFVGVMFAKGLALANDLPLIEVNHLEGHLAACELVAPDISYPHIALLVSGGHTSLYRVNEPLNYIQLGGTIDDAAGEAFDKTAKLLGFPYPGGAALATAGVSGHRQFIKLPVALSQRDNLNFSFSGLKTAVALAVKTFDGLQKGSAEHRDLCATVEHAIVEALVRKTQRACELQQLNTVVLAGGVAANQYLRQQMQQALGPRGCVIAPPARWCTDNAAMIGVAALQHFSKNEFGSLAAVPRAYAPLTSP